MGLLELLLRETCLILHSEKKKGFINIDLRRTQRHSTNLEVVVESWNLPTLTFGTLTLYVK